jgi:single-stranded-DNA-specific exonuclease
VRGAVAREWALLSPDPSLVRGLSARHGLAPAAAAVLANRGITDPRDVDRFLRGTLSDLPDPSLLKDVDKAAERLARAGRRGEPVLVYADYDADGATGAACLRLFLGEIFPGLPVRIHQNDRRRDGYGLQAHVLAQSAREGYRLVVSVDCGISDAAAVSEAAREAVEVIVTDHHLPGGPLPAAHAVVNPRRPDCPFPAKEVAGVGVAFLLLCALRKRLREDGFFDGRPEPSLRRYLDLVALGTVADMAPLRDGNRLLVREGLREIRKGPRPGVEALFAAAGVPHDTATEADLGFRVGPRLNAAGRVGDASRSARILVSDSREEAGRLARELNDDNSRRQREEERILGRVEEFLAAAGEIPPAIVLSDPAWNAGVLGIVASRILDRYARPVVLLSEEDGVAKGSCRSPDGFPIVDALSRLSHLLTRFGGHAQAAGVALPVSRLGDFRRGMTEDAARHAEVAPFVPRSNIDAEVRVDDLTPALLADLGLLAPFGAGNEEPLFLLRGARALPQGRFGRDAQHVRFEVAGERRRVEGVAFRRKEIPADPSGRSDLLVAVQENVFRGSRTLRLLLRDARPAGGPLLCGGPGAR